MLGRARLEPNATDTARRVPARGAALDAGLRTRMEWALGAPLGDVRVHTGPEAGTLAGSQSAQAVTVGQDVAFAPGAYQPGTFSGDLLVAHELAHAVEQRGHGTLDASRAEAQADQAAWAAAMRLHGQAHAQAPAPALAQGGLALRRCSRRRESEQLQQAIASGRALTADEARRAMELYRGLSEADRASFFTRYNTSGGVQRVMQALSADDAAGNYRLEVRDILTRVQQAATLQAFGGDQAALAAAQASAMRAQADADARAAAADPALPPSPAQIETARQQRAATQTAVQPTTTPLTWYQQLPDDTARGAWDAQATTAINDVVAYANSQPDSRRLGLTSADFVWNPNAVDGYGSNVLGLGQLMPDRRRIQIGRTWLLMAQTSRAYALSIAVHESRGHWEFGEKNQTYFNTVYEQARVQVPGAAATQSDTEMNTFGYRDTEIYSLLRSYPFHTPIAPGHRAALGQGVDPGPTVRWHLTGIMSTWPPTVWPALLRGLYVRLRLEPNITPAALQVFRDQVTAVVPEPQRSTILAP